MANKGKFINTSHSENINALVDSAKKIINNPYYLWNNMSPTIVTYYNINTEKSTLDEGFKNIVSDVGKDSPIWYNIISNFFLYGIERIAVQLDHGEYGIESGDITGEAIILPNTIIPYPGDYFKLSYTNDEFMFRVNGVTHDTLENGSNLYKLQYKLETRDHHDFKIENEYTMVTNNIGTGFNAVLNNKKIDLIKAIEDFLYSLRVYYKDTFYNDRVQSFIYKFKEMRFYDPYMTQFLINNKIMSGGEEYIYITHQIPTRQYFSIQYDRTFFRCLEKNDLKNARKYETKAISRYIDSIDTTIFGTRQEEYLEVEFRYNDLDASIYGILPCFQSSLIDHIENNELFIGKYSIYNIIVKYANGTSISDDDIDIMDFDFHNNIEIFYTIPCIIYCLENYIKRMMVENSVK